MGLDPQHQQELQYSLQASESSSMDYLLCTASHSLLSISLAALTTNKVTMEKQSTAHLLPDLRFICTVVGQKLVWLFEWIPVRTKHYQVEKKRFIKLWSRDTCFPTN